jgi:predicted DNA-binding transcriptional regulator AlpA
MTTDHQPAVLTPAEVARLARVSLKTWRKLAREAAESESSAFPRPIRLGRSVRYPRAAVLAFLGQTGGNDN